MVQLASCGNQFRSQNKNFSYKNNLANQILMRIMKGEWSKDRLEMAKYLKPRLMKLVNNVFYLRPEDLEMHEYKQTSRGEKLMKELPETMMKIKIRSRQDYFERRRLSQKRR